ncbi:MAG: lipopolysaccharide heptosyltransferase I [Polaromonas sp.]|nr:lipopolysaccharide heptosyltransferase I [Polaromonas sp.]
MKILLVKLSSLGDVVHTLPVVQDIHAALPDAQIDWVIEKSFAPLLAPLLAPGAGLSRVVGCELRRWRKAPLAAWLRGPWRDFKAELQGVAYDAVIDLQGLTKSALVARLARLAPGGKRFALANQTEGSSYEAPTRWVADVAIRIEPHVHAVQRGRELAAAALGYSVDSAAVYGLNTPSAEADRAQAAPETIAVWTPPGVALAHGTSRADKRWPLEHWIELGLRLNAAGFEVLLPHGSVDEYSTSHLIARALNALESAPPGARVLPVLALDALTRQLAGCAGVIGVDSGVSHIAVALGLPHVQIYNFDTAWRTGPADSPPGDAPHLAPGFAQAGHARQISLVAHPFADVDAVWQAWLTCGAAAVAPAAAQPPVFARSDAAPTA